MTASIPTAADEGAPHLARHRELLDEAERILAADAVLTWDGVWHVLLLLDEPPIERLRRALRRGRRADPLA